MQTDSVLETESVCSLRKKYATGIVLGYYDTTEPVHLWCDETVQPFRTDTLQGEPCRFSDFKPVGWWFG